MALRLNENVFFCVAQGLGVFLDLKNDAYSAIPIATGGGIVTQGDVVAAFRAHRAELIADGLILDSDGEGDFPASDDSRRNIRAWGCAEGTRLFGATTQLGNIHLRVHDYVDFYASMWGASRQLKHMNMYSIVCSVRAQKRSSTARRDDDARLQEALLAFAKLRPLYPKSYRCIVDALALLHFLARRRLHANWVFGVQAQPFGAHCWLEMDDVVLNESIEYTRQFTRIMVV